MGIKRGLGVLYPRFGPDREDSSNGPPSPQSDLVLAAVGTHRIAAGFPLLSPRRHGGQPPHRVLTVKVPQLLVDGGVFRRQQVGQLEECLAANGKELGG
jgi:hypothetical protein